MLDAGNLRQQFFQGKRHLAFDLAGAETRRLHHHVDHRHHDLRFLFARREQQGQHPCRDAGDEDRHRQPAPQGVFHQSLEPATHRTSAFSVL